MSTLDGSLVGGGALIASGASGARSCSRESVRARRTRDPDSGGGAREAGGARHAVGDVGVLADGASLRSASSTREADGADGASGLAESGPRASCAGDDCGRGGVGAVVHLGAERARFLASSGVGTKRAGVADTARGSGGALEGSGGAGVSTFASNASGRGAVVAVRSGGAGDFLVDSLAGAGVASAARKCAVASGVDVGSGGSARAGNRGVVGRVVRSGGARETGVRGCAGGAIVTAGVGGDAAETGTETADRCDAVGAASRSASGDGLLAGEAGDRGGATASAGVVDGAGDASCVVGSCVVITRRASNNTSNIDTLGGSKC